MDGPSLAQAQAQIYDDLRSLFDDKRAALLIHADKPINDRWQSIAYLLQAATIGTVIDTLKAAADRARKRAGD
ncbi:MAG: hypothetical protein NVS3B5_02090 [Sphingomicrobium sp.]